MSLISLKVSKERELAIIPLNNGDFIVEALSGKAPLPGEGEILVE